MFVSLESPCLFPRKKTSYVDIQKPEHFVEEVSSTKFKSGSQKYGDIQEGFFVYHAGWTL